MCLTCSGLLFLLLNLFTLRFHLCLFNLSVIPCQVPGGTYILHATMVLHYSPWVIALITLVVYCCLLLSPMCMTEPVHLYMPQLFTHCLPTIICVVQMIVMYMIDIYVFMFLKMPQKFQAK